MLIIKVAATTMLVTGNYIGNKMMVLAAMESGGTLLGGGVLVRCCELVIPHKIHKYFDIFHEINSV